jgi:hypothetical protein
MALKREDRRQLGPTVCPNSDCELAFWKIGGLSGANPDIWHFMNQRIGPWPK